MYSLLEAETATRVVFRNFAKFTEKDLSQSLFFNKVAGLRSYILKPAAESCRFV